MQNIPEDRENLILFLNTIGEARFETLLGILKIPTAYLSGKSAEPAVRVSGLIGLAEAPGGCGLERIRQALAKIYQANPPETPSLNDETLAEELLAQYRKKLENAIGTARFYGLPDRPLEKVFVELTVIEDFEIPRDAEYKALMDKELRRRRTLFPKDETEEDEVINPEETDEKEKSKEKKGAKDRKQLRKTRRTVKPEELLEAGKRSQVVGAPGCGKTTLLRWLALQTANTNDRLRVFIELKALKKAQFDVIDDNFSRFLFQQGVKKRFDDTDLTDDQFASLETAFREYYKAGRLVVLLDGLDEIAESERHRLRTAIENYSNHHEGGLTLIVSTRPYGYLRNFADLKAMEIEPLSDRQIEQFLDHWCEKPTTETVKANLRKNPNLRSLARFPFLLASIAHFNSAGNLPRIELYRKIIAELIDKIDKDKGIQTFRIDDPKGILKRSFLRQLSFERLFEGQTTELTERLVFSFEELVEQAEIFLRKKNRNFLPEDLAFDVCATPLLREVENERYTFAHLTIQEFLAAEELSKRDDCHRLFTKAFFNRQLAEMEVLPMTIGLADDPNEFYDLLSKTPESFNFIRLRLVGRSLGYHQNAVHDDFYQQWQTKLSDFGLKRIKGEKLFADAVLGSFTGIETLHIQKLNSGLLSALCDEYWPILQRTAEAIGKLGNDFFAEILCDKESEVRRRAADALGKLGHISPDVTHALFEGLRDQNHFVRQRAAAVLGKLGHASPDVIRALTETLRDYEWYVRLRAIEALVNLGNTSPDVIRALFEGLRDPDQWVRKSADDALGKLGNVSPDVIGVLFEGLRDENWQVRQSSADALGKLGNVSPDVIRALFEGLCDQNHFVRQTAANALGKLGNASPDVIRTLFEGLRGEDGWIRRSADKALSNLGQVSPDAIHALSEGLRDQNPGVRRCAADALGNLGHAAPDVICALCESLGDQDPDVHRHTVNALVQLGSTSPDLIRTLTKDLCNKDSYVRRRAADALVQLGSTPPDLIRILTKDLCNEDSFVRQSAAETLGKLGNASPDVIRALSNALRDENWFVRYRTAEALGKLGNVLPDAINALSEDLRDPNLDSDVRQSAAAALGKLGNISPDAIHALSEALRDPDSDVRRRAAYELLELGNVLPNVIRVLSQSLSDWESNVRLRAAHALINLGKISPEVIRILFKALNDQGDHERGVRQRAAEALKDIAVDSPEEFRKGLKLLLSDSDHEIRKVAIRSIGFYSTDLELLDDLKKLTKWWNFLTRKAAEDAYRKYKFKLEMLGLLPA